MPGITKTLSLSLRRVPLTKIGWIVEKTNKIISKTRCLYNMSSICKLFGYDFYYIQLINMLPEAHMAVLIILKLNRQYFIPVFVFMSLPLTFGFRRVKYVSTLLVP